MKKAAKKARLIYWLTGELSIDHRGKATALQGRGYETMFCASVDQFLAALHTKRAGIILVSDDGHDHLVAERILTLVNLPELQGAKLVLVSGKGGDVYKYLASCGSFRDIVPLDLEPHHFAQRVLFASAGRPLPYKKPSGMLTVNQIAAVSMPARLVWVSGSRIRIECRLSASIGANLNMSGEFARALGVNTVSLTVEEMHRSHLTYRFSDALIASWNVPSAQRDQAERLLKIFREQNQGPRCRIFIAAKSHGLRSMLIERLSHPKFDVTSALHKQSIVHEPKYFTPHVVVIEDSLCFGEDLARFELMLEQLLPETTVVVLGSHPEIMNLPEKYPSANIRIFNKTPNNLSNLILAKYRKVGADESSSADDDASYVASENSYSFATISFPARIKQLHPQTVQVATPFAIGNYALCQLEAPFVRRIVGRNPYIKMVDTYRDLSHDAAPFLHLADAYICDFDNEERTELALGLVDTFAEGLVRYGVNRKAAQTTIATKVAEMAPLEAVELTPAAAVGAGLVQSVAPTVAATPGLSGSIATGVATGVEAVPTIATRLPRRDYYPAVAIRDDDDDDYKPFVLTDAVKRDRRDAQLRQSLMFVMVIVFASAVLWGIAVFFEPRINKLSDIYSDQFRKLGPALNNRTLPVQSNETDAEQ